MVSGSSVIDQDKRRVQTRTRGPQGLLGGRSRIIRMSPYQLGQVNGGFDCIGAVSGTFNADWRRSTTGCGDLTLNNSAPVPRQKDPPIPITYLGLRRRSGRGNEACAPYRSAFGVGHAQQDHTLRRGRGPLLTRILVIRDWKQDTLRPLWTNISDEHAAATRDADTDIDAVQRDIAELDSAVPVLKRILYRLPPVEQHHPGRIRQRSRRPSHHNFQRTVWRRLRSERGDTG
jgi:hypothetical protein